MDHVHKISIMVMIHLIQVVSINVVNKIVVNLLLLNIHYKVNVMLNVLWVMNFMIITRIV